MSKRIFILSSLLFLFQAPVFCMQAEDTDTVHDTEATDAKQLSIETSMSHKDDSNLDLGDVKTALQNVENGSEAEGAEPSFLEEECERVAQKLFDKAPSQAENLYLDSFMDRTVNECLVLQNFINDGRYKTTVEHDSFCAYTHATIPTILKLFIMEASVISSHEDGSIIYCIRPVSGKDTMYICCPEVMEQTIKTCLPILKSLMREYDYLVWSYYTRKVHDVAHSHYHATVTQYLQAQRLIDPKKLALRRLFVMQTLADAICKHLQSFEYDEANDD